MSKALNVKTTRGRPIPGVTGKRIPGSARLPTPGRAGGILTNVPFQKGGSSVFREFHRQQVRDSNGRFAGGWGFAWQGLQGIDENLWDWNGKIHTNIKTAAQAMADEMVSYMQANAPWTDDTGAARANLQAVVIWEDDEHFSIALGHGADIYYGVWLEVRWGGRFAIVGPTAELFAPQLAARIGTMT